MGGVIARHRVGLLSYYRGASVQLCHWPGKGWSQECCGEVWSLATNLLTLLSVFQPTSYHWMSYAFYTINLELHLDLELHLYWNYHKDVYLTSPKGKF